MAGTVFPLCHTSEPRKTPSGARLLCCITARRRLLVSGCEARLLLCPQRFSEKLRVLAALPQEDLLACLPSSKHFISGRATVYQLQGPRVNIRTVKKKCLSLLLVCRLCVCITTSFVCHHTVTKYALVQQGSVCACLFSSAPVYLCMHL